MNDILAILSGGDYVSGEKISQELGISRAAVWKRIAQLREEGWQIEAARPPWLPPHPRRQP